MGQITFGNNGTTTFTGNVSYNRATMSIGDNDVKMYDGKNYVSMRKVLKEHRELTTVMKLLIEKGIITQQEISGLLNAEDIAEKLSE